MKAARRRAMVEKLLGDIARLEKEIAERRAAIARAKAKHLAAKPKGFPSSAPSWFAAWSRLAPPLARAVGQLDRARRRFAGAATKAERATAVERETERRLARIAQANIGYFARIDARAGDGLADRWQQEREAEAKREAALRKRHARAARKAEAREKPSWLAKPRRLPDPIKQPELADEMADDVPPPRPGLLPGTYAVLPATRVSRLVDRPRLPAAWTAAHVGVRLIEAHKVLERSPASIWPKGFGAAWPLYKVEASEELVAPGEARRPRGAPSAEAVARMNEAILWPMQFLANRPGAAADVNFWAQDAAWEQMEFDARSAPWDLLQVIADCLNAAKEPVR